MLGCDHVQAPQHQARSAGHTRQHRAAAALVLIALPPASPGWAVTGAPVRGAPADRVPREQRLAARARAALLPRGHEAPGMHAAVADRVPDRRAQLAAQAVELLDRQLARRPPRAQLRAPQVSSASRLPTPAITPWSSSRAFSGAVPRPTRSRKSSRADLGGVRPDVGEVGLDHRAAEPALVAQRHPPAVGELEREAVPAAGASSSSTAIRPAMPRCRPSSGPPSPVSTHRNFPRRCAWSAAGRRAPRRSRPGRGAGRRRCPGRRRDDLATQDALDLLPGALGFGELGHLSSLRSARRQARHLGA